MRCGCTSCSWDRSRTASSGRPPASQARGGSSIASGVCSSITETDTLIGKVSEDAPTDNKELERALHAAIKKVTHAGHRPSLQHRDRRDDGVRQRSDQGDRDPARVVRDVREDPVAVRAARRRGDVAAARPSLDDRVRAMAGVRRGEARARRASCSACRCRQAARRDPTCRSTRPKPRSCAAAKADDKVQPFLAGKPIKREIYVKGRLVNLVV